MNEPKVTIYKNAKQKKGGEDFDFGDVMTAIKDGTWKGRVLQYQSLPETTEEEVENKKEFKRQTLCFTGSGTFDTRKDDAIKTHNGKIIIDFDHIDNMAETITLLNADEFTEYGFKSISGNGYCVVAAIEPGKHRESFEGLKEYYATKYGLKADPSCVNESRLRFISYDPDLYHNPKRSLYVIGRDYVGHVKRTTHLMINNAKEGEVHNTLIRASRLMGGYIAGGLIREDEGFEWLVDCMRSKPGVESIEIEKKKILDGITNGKLEPVSVAAFVQTLQTNDNKREVLKEIYSFCHEINRAGRKFTEADVAVLYERYNNRNGVIIGRIEIENIFKRVFEENPDEFGINDKPEIYKVEVFLRKNYDFARNVVTQVAEYRKKGAATFDRLNTDTLFRTLQHAGFKFPLDKLKSLLKSDFIVDYNPFIEYFKSLPAWDGVTDHITQLASYVQTENQNFYQQQFKKALVRSVGCGLYGVENRIVIVYVGEKQSTGKSTFIRFLSPFGHKYYTEAPIRNDKDTSFSFAENFIYNLEELASLNNTEVNRLKAIISTATIKERKAYAVNAEEQPRRCNFFGSTNKQEFLIDSENTRWLCFNVRSIAWGYKSDIDINKVWAQAFALWHSGEFNSQLTAEEAATRDASNKDYEVNDLEKELIKRLFECVEPGEDGAQFMSNADILEALVKSWDGGSSQLNGRLIPKHMVQLGFSRDVKKVNGHTTRGFYVRVVPSDLFSYQKTFKKLDGQFNATVNEDLTNNVDEKPAKAGRKDKTLF